MTLSIVLLVRGFALFVCFVHVFEWVMSGTYAGFSIVLHFSIVWILFLSDCHIALVEKGNFSFLYFIMNNKMLMYFF